ncbi:penicillin-binding protein activator [Anaeromyxobacter sp. Fw109-5]|uniref:penicillin-binding protein activator n=1 Tax=Anaeromyxobacter sp. (strain Fw109-5) TaxID=404589 RepID=UPI0000ED7B9F|nr:penicillin-binding protein activator [Anaeromyxobacter sp. Fw109-5]ABS28650.1 ABC branched chain amino acid transporter, periplasmic ligand binding protein [Anaeromyxobacter sp. Fw109-5]
MRVTARKVLAFLLLSLAGCPKRVVVNGQEMSVQDADDLARRELDGVRAEAKGLPPAQAAERLEAFAKRYRGVPAGGEALHEAAELRRAGGEPARAAEDLRTLLAEHPLHARAVEAKYLLALSDIELGRTRDGLASLATLYEKLPSEARPDAAARAAEAALAAGEEAEAVRWLATLAEGQQGAARERTLARAVEAVDALGLEDADALRRALPADAAIQEPLAMKAARIHLHLRDYAKAEQAAREVFLRWPHGRYADEAKRLVERISRLTYVRPNVLGVAVPLSGNYKRWGEAILQGVSLALEGSAVKLAVRDTRGEPDGAAAALEALVLEEGAIAVVGGVTNAEGERAAAAAEELQVPFVSLSKQEGITEAGPHVFQNMLTASEQADALLGLAMGKRGMRRFAILYPSMTYGVELANAFWDELEARGGEVRAAETYAADRTTFTPLVKSMVGKLYLEDRRDWQEQAREIADKEKDPFRRRKALEKARERLAPVTDFDAIFIPDFARNVKLIAPALAVEDVVTQTCEPDALEKLKKLTGRPDLRPVQLLGANGWSGDPSLFDQAPGGAGRHLRCAIYVDGFFAGSARAGTRRFVERFQQKHPGHTPTILEASAYDAAGMARQVMERDRAQTRAALRDGLAGVRGFSGATGELSMGPDRTPVRELFFLTVDSSGLREMKPEELAAPGAGGM